MKNRKSRTWKEPVALSVPNPQPQTPDPQVLSAAPPARVCLAQPGALAAGGFAVDRAAGILRNVSLLTAGPAIGHGFDIDAVMLKQLSAGITAKPKGVMSRLTHPEEGIFGGGTDAIELLVGRVRNARVEGNQVRGDVHFGRYAESSPKGNLKQYLFDIAEDDPEAIGLSIVFTPDEYEQREGMDPLARIKEVFAVDFVGDPGANPAGLLSQGPAANPAAATEGVSAMNPKLLAFLKSKGLKPDATLAQAIQYWHALEAGDRTQADKLAEGDPAPAAPAAPPSDPTVVPDITPAAGEAEEDFVTRFVNDEAMMTKYPDGAERTNKAKEIFAAASAPAEAPPAEPVPAEPGLAAKPADVLRLDTARRQAIHALAKKSGLDKTWAQGLCDRQVSLAQAVELVNLASAHAPAALGAISVGDDRNLTSLGTGVEHAIMLRAGLKVEKPHERSQRFRHLSMIEIGREYLRALGIDPGLYGRSEIVRFCFSRAALARVTGAVSLAMGTTDFPYILANVARKSLRQAYELAELTWSRWARETTTPDFKQVSRLILSNAPALNSMAEGEEYKYGAMTEGRETYTLGKFGKGLKFTREMMINDDLSAFNRVLPAMGAMAAYMEDTVVYAILTANAALADGVALFSQATHANVYEGLLSVTTLGGAKAKMMRQTHLDGATYLSITPRFLLIPSELEVSGAQLIASVVDPAMSNATPNPFAGKLEPIATPHLTNTAQWYLAASPDQVDTVEVCFLEGERTPFLDEEEDFDTDCRKYKVRHQIVAKALDYRGLLRSTGATATTTEAA